MTTKPRPWDRLLWGIQLSGSLKDDVPALIGVAWSRNQVVQHQYDGEPTRTLLFNTRQQARNWCSDQMHKWRVGRKQGDLVLIWKVRPVRVREIVEVEE